MSSQLILLIIVAYFGLLLLIAWITGRKSSSNDAFFLGNRKSPWYIVAIGMVGSSLSGMTFVSVVQRQEQTFQIAKNGGHRQQDLISIALASMYCPRTYKRHAAV